MSGERGDTLRWVQAARLDDVSEEDPVAVMIDGVEIALFRDADRVFALADRCTHGNASLSEGYVENGCIECPLHQALFDLASGEVRRGPAVEGVRSFEVQLNGDWILVGL